MAELEDLEKLEGPYEILDLGDRGHKELRILSWKLGRMVIQPRETGVAKEIKALRVWVPKEIKPLFPDYWDITAQTLIAQLIPHLERPGWEEARFIITKYGEAPKARFSLEVIPPP